MVISISPEPVPSPEMSALLRSKTLLPPKPPLILTVPPPPPMVTSTSSSRSPEAIIRPGCNSPS